MTFANGRSGSLARPVTTIEIGRGSLRPVLRSLVAVDRELSDRGMDPVARRDLADALYVCNRALATLEGMPGALPARDAWLLLKRVPSFADGVKVFTAQIDAEN